MTSFKNTIRHSFPYLFEKLRFEFLDLENDYGGNIVIVQSERLKIRFVNDRADFSLYVSRIENPENWIDFYKIMDLLKKRGKLNIEYNYSNKIGAVSRLLDQYFPETQKLFLE